MPGPTSADAVRRILVAGRRDPVAWVRQFLRFEPWHRQARILESVFRHPRVAIKASHAVGKTAVAARAALAFFYLHPGCRVVTTAPTWSAVQKLLWAEIGAAFEHLPKVFGGELLGTELRAARDWIMFGISTTEPERMQGHHARHMLIVLDEAMGVRPEIWAAVESMRAGGDVHVLAIGNPTIAAGPFYDAFSSNRDGWHCETISAFDSPNLLGLTPKTLAALPDAELDRNVAPYLVTRRWVRERIDEWGEGSSLWQARVLGEFPTESEDALIALAWLEGARHKAGRSRPGAVWQAGIDVAGPGSDETVLVVRRDTEVKGIWSYRDADPRGLVLAQIRSVSPPGRNIDVCVDSAGIGYYMARHLADNGLQVSDVNVASRADENDRFLNLRAELFWQLRERFQTGDVRNLTDDLTISQLSSIRYKHSARGLVQIESKDEMRKRGGKSPDRADALMLAFARGGRVGLGSRQLGREILL